MHSTRIIIRSGRLFLAVAIIGLALAGCSSIRSAKEDPAELWMRALKPMGSPVYYVGSEGDYSYFKSGHKRYKSQTLKTRLPQMFPLKNGKPYVVTEDMVPKY